MLSQCLTNCLVSILVSVYCLSEVRTLQRRQKSASQFRAFVQWSRGDANHTEVWDKTSQLPFIFPMSLFSLFQICPSLSLLFLFLFASTPFPNGLVLKLIEVTHLDWIRRFPFLFPLLFKVLMQRFVPLKPSCRWWKKTQMTIPDPLLTSTTSPPIRETRGPSPTTSSSADSEDDLSNNWPSVAAPNELWDVRR